MNPSDLQKQLSTSLVVNMTRDAGGICIVTGLCYPNGDSVTLWLKFGRNLTELSDAGNTLRLLRQSGVSIGGERRRYLQQLCKRTLAQLTADEISKSISADSVGDACLEFCELLLHVSSIHFQSEPARRSALPEQIDRLVQSKIKPTRDVARGWTLHRADPKGSFPVDYHVNGRGPARNLFFVTSVEKALLVASVVNFLKFNRQKVPTMTVIDPGTKLSAVNIDRLQLANDHIVQGVAGESHERITKFLLASK